MAYTENGPTSKVKLNVKSLCKQYLCLSTCALCIHHIYCEESWETAETVSGRTLGLIFEKLVWPLPRKTDCPDLFAITLRRSESKIIVAYIFRNTAKDSEYFRKLFRKMYQSKIRHNYFNSMFDGKHYLYVFHDVSRYQ